MLKAVFFDLDGTLLNSEKKISEGSKEALKKVTNNFTILNALFITKYEFTYNARYRNNEHVIKVEQKEDFVNVYLDDNSIDIVSNPLIIEDLKIYL